MNKKKTLKKRGFSLSDMRVINIPDESKFKDFNASEFFKNKEDVADALQECLVDGDSETFMEILEAYISVNK